MQECLHANKRMSRNISCRDRAEPITANMSSSKQPPGALFVFKSNSAQGSASNSSQTSPRRKEIKKDAGQRSVAHQQYYDPMSFTSRDAAPALILPGMCSELLAMRFSALAEGKNTDCSFLIGPEEGNKQVMHAVKFNLVTASSFMEGLFNSVLCPPSPIRISYVTPEIFKLVIEFTHFDRLMTPVDLLGMVNLLIAADFFLIDTLKKWLIPQINCKVAVNNFWIPLSTLLQAKQKDAANEIFQSFLSCFTLACISQPSFVDATLASVKFLLAQDRLTSSEMEIIKHCIRWATKRPEGMSNAMRLLLPDLRLLCLTERELTMLPPFLTSTEKLALLEHFISCGSVGKIPETICRKGKRCQGSAAFQAESAPEKGKKILDLQLDKERERARQHLLAMNARPK